MDPRTLLSKGARQRWPDGGESILRTFDACLVSCPTGRVIVCDPSRRGERAVVDLPTGDLQLSLSVLDFSATQHFPDGFSRVTAIVLQVPGVEVIDWTGSSEAFTVDAGTGVILDVTNETVLATAFAAEGDADLEVIREVLDHRFTIRPPDEEPAVLAFFECGMGDGTYALWTGRDESGAVVALLADLELLAHASAD